MDRDSKLKVSVIIRAFNAVSTIDKAINSALLQTLSKDLYEIIIVDDGSTDGTDKIIKGYTNKDKKIVLLSQSNQGPTEAANNGLLLAKGEYAVFLDSDDWFEPNLLFELSNFLDLNPKIDCVYSDYFEKTDNKTILVSPDSIFQSLIGGMLIRLCKIKEVGLFRKGIFFGEYDLFLRMEGKCQSAHLNKPLFTYVRHSKSQTADKDRVKDAIKQLKMLHPDKVDKISNIREY